MHTCGVRIPRLSPSSPWLAFATAAVPVVALNRDHVRTPCWTVFALTSCSCRELLVCSQCLNCLIICQPLLCAFISLAACRITLPCSSTHLVPMYCPLSLPSSLLRSLSTSFPFPSLSLSLSSLLRSLSTSFPFPSLSLSLLPSFAPSLPPLLFPLSLSLSSSLLRSLSTSFPFPSLSLSLFFPSSLPLYLLSFSLSLPSFTPSLPPFLFPLSLSPFFPSSLPLYLLSFSLSLPSFTPSLPPSPSPLFLLSFLPLSVPGLPRAVLISINPHGIM